MSVLIDPDEGHNPRNPLARKAQVHLLLRMLHRYLARTLRADAALAP